MSVYFWIWVALAVFLVVGIAVSVRRPEEREWLRRRWWVVVIISIPVVLGLIREAPH